MTREEHLERIKKEIDDALENYRVNNKEWQAIDNALSALCGGLGNGVVKTVLPKIVAVDQLYRAGLIRYKKKPAPGEPDVRYYYYRQLADAIIQLNLDSILSGLKNTYSCLDANCLDEVVRCRKRFSQAIFITIDHSGISFALKYLHFNLPEFFPIYDAKARKRAHAILHLTCSNGYVIVNRDGYDGVKGIYNRFCRAVLAIQSTLKDAGLGEYSLAELDRYLYGFVLKQPPNEFGA